MTSNLLGEMVILAGKLVSIIEKNSDVIAEEWVKEVTTLPYTRSYWNQPLDELHERAASVCRRIGYFVDKRMPRERLAAFYRRMGGTRKEEGYPVEEVVMALFLLKRQIWLFIMQEGFLSTHLELYQALELNNRVVLYFDRAVYHVAQAYSDAEEKEETGKNSQ
ncbi:MAG: RsbRD N-terminal domain-containing protein [Actinomycetota bacterium]|nr:RsbRD N-terminal domain-containing protein [Actinomycetota bacterium]